MHKLAQSSLNVIKPSRSANARKTRKLRLYRGETVGADFPSGSFLKSGELTGVLTLPTE